MNSTTDLFREILSIWRRSAYTVYVFSISLWFLPLVVVWAGFIYEPPPEPVEPILTPEAIASDPDRSDLFLAQLNVTKSELLDITVLLHRLQAKHIAITDSDYAELKSFVVYSRDELDACLAGGLNDSFDQMYSEVSAVIEHLEQSETPPTAQAVVRFRDEILPAARDWLNDISIIAARHGINATIEVP